MSAPRPVNDRTGERDAYLALLAGDRGQGRLLEIRIAASRGMRRRFIQANRLDHAASVIAAHAAHSDVYCGVLLRERRAGGRGAVAASHLAFVEIDSSDAQDRVQAFGCPPSMIVASGSPGHLHLYFRLRTPIGVLELERANRLLAAHLGGDLASVDAARILRPCSSWNHKHSPAAPVELVDYSPKRVYELAELIDGLPEPPRTARLGLAGPRRLARHPLDELLLAIPAAEYVRALTGREPDRAGFVSCPFHDDHEPSLKLYEDGTWYCFACQIGGSVYDFASRAWSMQTTGRAFLRVRARLACELGVTPPACTDANTTATAGGCARG
jgi:hypothetical protein